MNWEVIDKNRYDILKKVVSSISLNNYYLAGGTALALQTGIRESFDFDFFVREEFNEDILITELEKLGNLEVSVCRKGTVHIILNDVQFTFLYFPNELISELVKVDEINGLYLASIQDISLMKLIAISQRGTKKDFFDLHFICNNQNITIKYILNNLDKKYNANKINYSHIIQSLTYFEDAKDENLPKVFIKYNWEDIMKYYIDEQKRIFIEN